MLIRYALYLIRWQLSTPILALCVTYLSGLGNIWCTVLANLIGGLIFFWVDLFLFRVKIDEPIWAVKEKVVCADCGTVSRGYRLVTSRNYDKSKDPKPKFRCEVCSVHKTGILAQNGVEVG